MILPLAVLVALVVPAAHADEGPPPECPVGRHEEYHAGHKCVPDGWHLADHDGIVMINDATGEEQPFGVPPDPPVRSIQLPASVPATPAEPAQVPKAARGCGCDGTAGAPTWGVLSGVLVGALTARARRSAGSERRRGDPSPARIDPLWRIDTSG